MASPGRAPAGGASDGWQPVDVDGRVRFGFSPSQKARAALLIGLITAPVVGAGVLGGRPALVVAAGVLAISALGLVMSAGAELGPTTLTVFGPSLRRHVLWARTVRWLSIVDIRTTATGETWLALPGEPPLVLRAPKRRWLAGDPDYDRKIFLLVTWWEVHCSDARYEHPRTTLARVQQALADDGASWWDGRPGPGVDAPVDHDLRPDRPDGVDRSAGFPAAGPESIATARPSSLADRWAAEEAREHGDGEPRPPFPFIVVVAFVLVALGVGYLLIGRDLLVVAIALLVLLRFGRDPGRPLALGGFVLLIVAAVATVVQDSPATVSLSYASRRTLAAEAGAVVGVLVTVATIIFAITERSLTPAPVRALWSGVERLQLLTLRRVAPAWLRAAVPYVLVAGIAVAIRVLGAPSALPDAYRPLIENLRLGTGYSLAEPSGGVPTGTIPPLSPLLMAYSPLGPRVALLLVSLATVVVVGWTAHRRWGRAAGIMAAAAAAVLPAMWAEQLPVQLAGLFVVAGVALADPGQLTTTRAIGAGVALGLAALARPEALIALLVVALWISRQPEYRRSWVVGVVVAAIAVFLPWWDFVFSEFHTPWPMSTLGATLNDPATSSRLPGWAAVAAGAMGVSALVVALGRLRHRRDVLLPFFVLPAVAVAVSLTDPLRRDPLTWSAPLAAVVLGWWLAQVVRAQLGPVLEIPYRDVVDWDVVLDEQRRRLGLSQLSARPDGGAVIDPEPEEDQLFL